MIQTTRHSDLGRRWPGRSNRPVRAGYRSGLTLTELIVSAAILVMMLAIVNGMLASSRRTIRQAQTIIRVNADMRAAVDRIRKDLARITKDGFLGISEDINQSMHITFTAVGVFRSMCDDTVANAARIDYGVTTDAQGNTPNILWRRAILMDPDDATTDDKDDHVKGSLSEQYAMTIMPRQYAGSILAWTSEPFYAPKFILPAAKLSDLDGLWPYLIGNVTDLKIQWSNGTLEDPNDPGSALVWHDKSKPHEDPGWTTRILIDQDFREPNADIPEFQVPGTKGPRYNALWTYGKKDNWPTAVRMQLKIEDQPFEIIVALPK